jgi:hypothetical protein
MVCLFTERYVRIAHPHCFGVITINRSASTEDKHLETDACPTSSGMDAIDCHEVLQRPSIGTVPIFMQYCMSSSTVLVPFTIPSLTGVHTVRGQPAFMCAVGVTLPV